MTIRVKIEGLDDTMGGNHFGHFLHTNLLLPNAKKSARRAP